MAEENFWERFNEGKLDRRTFVRVASLLGGAAVFGLPLLGCQPATPQQGYEMKMAVPGAMLQVDGIYSGDARGVFVQEGVKNALTEFAGGADQVRAVVTGGYPLGVISPTAGMSAMLSGEPARMISGGYNASGVGFIVKADSPLKKPEDLKGKKFKISYSRPASNSHIVAFLGLKAIGIDGNDKNQVEFVAAGSTADSWTAVNSGLVDIGWSTEPTISDLETKKVARLLWMTPTLVKDWVDVGIMTSQPFIDAHPKELQSWMNAYVKSNDWVKNNYAEAAKDLAQVLGIDPAVATLAFSKVPKEVWSNAMPKVSMVQMAQASVDFKVFAQMPDMKVFVNQSFLPANLRDSSY
ncbi:MAG: ABC transporter substrate-binding protein [Dehalococcoidia bacterium]|nr:ABC transporter substrate-binding protein [Dehalococcoidia bacterium]